MSDNAADRKRLFRDEARLRASGLSGPVMRAASELIQRKVIDSHAFMDAGTVCCYSAMKNEVQTELIIEAALRCGKKLMLPLFTGTEYSFSELSNREGLKKGHMGIMEPASASGELFEGKVLVVVPGLAFDLECKRIGRGGGYYDRMLARLRNSAPGCVFTGVCFDSALMTSVPSDAWDVEMDIVITEKHMVVRQVLNAALLQLDRKREQT